ncbi:MAG: hypothetical protein QOG20_5502 [Pseudonocardiales bacterium]|nr:hypothetical protein [Pseudonocardiales bacterium]
MARYSDHGVWRRGSSRTRRCRWIETGKDPVHRSGPQKACARGSDRVVRAATSLIAEADLASVTLRAPDGTFHTAVETDPLAMELEVHQAARAVVARRLRFNR